MSAGAPILSARKRWLFSGVLIIVTILACEAVVRLAAVVSPKAARVLGAAPETSPDTPPAEISDARFGVRPNPAFPDHDAAGWRNASIPERATVVALGDSQTYGAGVARDEAWPQVVARETGVSTYQIAWGGFGPVHSLLLIPDALARRPDLIIEAFYLGNDLYDAYSLVYLRHQRPDLRTLDSGVLRRITEADARETIEAKVEGAYARMLGEPMPVGADRTADTVWRYSYLYRLTRARLDDGPHWNALKAWFRRHPEWGGIPFDIGRLHTIFTPTYRLTALDLNDPRIEEGLRLSLEAIRLMHAQARLARVDFRVLLIPTKESVFTHGVTQPTARVGDAMRALAEQEDDVRARAIASFEKDGIPWIDGRAALADALEQGPQPYPITQDGHPNEVGQRALAALVAKSVSRRP